MRLPRNDGAAGPRRAYAAAFVLLPALFYGCRAGGLYGFAIHPDEFGYWVPAAWACGRDWSGAASLGSYYSFGYSLVLFPVFALSRSGVAAYRAAVAVNFAMLSGMCFLLRWIAGRLFPGAGGRWGSGAAAAAAFYPPFLLYAGTTMAETPAAFMYVLDCALLLRYLERRGAGRLAVLLAALVFTHFVHMRTVPLLAAGALAVLYGGLPRRRGAPSACLAAALAALLLFAAGIAAKEALAVHAWGGAAGAFRANDYAGRAEALRRAVSPGGMGGLAASLAGKLLYLGLSGFGTAFWGLRHALRAVRRGSRGEGAFWLFILLGAAGAAAVAAAATAGASRADLPAYGRYHEYTLPVLMMAGLHEMGRSRRPAAGTAAIAAAELALLAPVLYVLRRHSPSGMQPCMMYGMSYLYDAEGFRPVRFYAAACGYGILLSAALAAAVSAARRKGCAPAALALAVAMEAALAAQALAATAGAGGIGGYRDMVFAGKLQELAEARPGGRVLYIRGGGDSAAGAVQFHLRDTEVRVLDMRGSPEGYGAGEMGGRDLVFTDAGDSRAGWLSRKYARRFQGGHFVLYYNDYNDDGAGAGG